MAAWHLPEAAASCARALTAAATPLAGSSSVTMPAVVEASTLGIPASALYTGTAATAPAWSCIIAGGCVSADSPAPAAAQLSRLAESKSNSDSARDVWPSSCRQAISACSRSSGTALVCLSDAMMHWGSSCRMSACDPALCCDCLLL